MTNYKTMLKAAMMTPGANGRWGLPLLLEGKPGSAKTSVISQVTTGLGLHCEVIISSLREPSDFLGLPFPDGARVHYLTPSWAHKVAQHEGAVVFLDELNTAPPAVQAALLRITLDGVVGDFHLPSSVRFVAAQNAVGDAAGGWDLAPPLANRFGHVDWPSVSVGDWTDYMLGGVSLGTPTDLIAMQEDILARWPAAWAQARGTVTAFLRQRPDLLLQQPKSGDPAASKAWPSPRSWENATRALASAAVHGLDDETRDAFVAAFVGNGPVVELTTWLRRQDLPVAEDVLDGKVAFWHDPNRLDRTAAVMGACGALLASPTCPKRDERAKVLWQIIEGLVDTAADLTVAPARIMAKAGLTKDAKSALHKLQPVLAAAV